MKICGRCGEELEERGEYNPAQELGGTFIEDVGESDADDLCLGATKNWGLLTCSGLTSEWCRRWSFC